MTKIDIPATKPSVQLTIVWSNCNPPLLTTEPRPSIMWEKQPATYTYEGRKAIRHRTPPKVTIWDWNTVPDALSVGLVVRALIELKIVKRRDLDAMNAREPLDYAQLVTLLGPNAFVSEEWEEETIYDGPDLTDAVAVLSREELDALGLGGVAPPE